MAQTDDVRWFSTNWTHAEVGSAAEVEATLEMVRGYQRELADKPVGDLDLPLRTITLREPRGHDKLTIWYHRLASYQVRLEIPGLAVTFSEGQMERIEAWALRFYAEPREHLFRELMREEGAKVGASFPGLLRALTKSQS